MNTCTAIFQGKRVPIEMERDILSGAIKMNELSDLRCPICDAQAQLARYTTRKWHFRAAHEPTCDIVNDGQKHKAHRINEDTLIDTVDTILNYTDHAPSSSEKKPPKPVGEDEDDPTKTDDDTDEIDTVVKYGIRRIHSLSGIIDYIKKNGLDADIGGGLTGRDLLLYSRELRKVRKEGMNGFKIAITKRASPNGFCNPIELPDGYTLLRDAFATDRENAVLFLVKLSRNDQNEEFQKRIFAKNEKDSYIFILGNWEEYPHDYYDIYKSSEINSHCFMFRKRLGVK